MKLTVKHPADREILLRLISDWEKEAREKVEHQKKFLEEVDKSSSSADHFKKSVRNRLGELEKELNAVLSLQLSPEYKYLMKKIGDRLKTTIENEIKVEVHPRVYITTE